jgi:hypothetical protein
MVMIILVLVVTISIFGMGGKSNGEVVLELNEVIAKVFKNASIRSQAFQIQVDVRVVVGEEGEATFYLEMVASNPELPVVRVEDLDEEGRLVRESQDSNVRLWSGEDKYSLPDGVKMVEYSEIVDGKNELVFNFFPDGEALGPRMKFQVGDRFFELTVDRLNGQLVYYEMKE